MSQAKGAFNVFNSETTLGVIQAAIETRSPVFIQTSLSIVNFFGCNPLKQLIESLIPKAHRSLFTIHLDHCDDLTQIKKCIEAGWDSVMIDVSAYPLKENIKKTKQIVEIAHHHGVLVEGELGVIGGEEDGFEANQSRNRKVTLDQILEFYDKTKVDLLAIGIGNKHGYYSNPEPPIDLDLLAKTHELIPNVKLVLHGGSGISNPQILKLLAFGVKKINISTEIKDAYLNALSAHIDNGPIHNMKSLIDSCTKAVKSLVIKKINLFSS